LEGLTKDEIRIFEALFKGVSTQFGPLTSEKSFENPDFIFCQSFQNLHLGGVKLLQKIIASQKTNTSPDMLLLSFVIILQSCYKGSSIPENQRIASHGIALLLSCVIILQSFSTKIVASQKTNTSPDMLLLSFVIILQSCYKDSSIPENQRIASHRIASHRIASHCYYLV
jgi:uncharacterized protein (UPF0147 family)